jgi:hypothetical protein
MRDSRGTVGKMGQPKPTDDDDVPNELRSLVHQLATLSAADRERIVRLARRMAHLFVSTRERRRTVSWSDLRDARGIAQLGGDAVKDTEALYDG